MVIIMNKYIKVIDLYIKKIQNEKYPEQERLDFLLENKLDYMSISQMKTSNIFKLFIFVIQKWI